MCLGPVFTRFTEPEVTLPQPKLIEVIASIKLGLHVGHILALKHPGHLLQRWQLYPRTDYYYSELRSMDSFYTPNDTN